MSTEPTPSPAQAAPEFTLHAWVDESIHSPASEVPEVLYVLAATDADPSACDPTRAALRNLVRQTLNRKDLKLVDALRAEGTMARALRVDFGLPSVEPMLWVPDAIAGAVSAARKGVEVTHRNKLGGMVTEYDIVL